jgi:hypothetical protein
LLFLGIKFEAKRGKMPSGDKINFIKKIFLINCFMKAIKTLESSLELHATYTKCSG